MVIREAELEHLTDIFTRLLLCNEARGPHATGAAWVNADGNYGLLKAPMTASRFVTDPRYMRLLAGVDSGTSVLMGHTRWRTQGSEWHNANNHPIWLAGNTQTAMWKTTTRCSGVFTTGGKARWIAKSSHILPTPRPAPADGTFPRYYCVSGVERARWP